MRLFECIRNSSGIYWVNGKQEQLLPDINKGAIVNVINVVLLDEGVGAKLHLQLADDNGATHPVIKTPLLRVMCDFREITQDTDLNIEELLNEAQTC